MNFLNFIFSTFINISITQSQRIISLTLDSKLYIFIEVNILKSKLKNMDKICLKFVISIFLVFRIPNFLRAR